MKDRFVTQNFVLRSSSNLRGSHIILKSQTQEKDCVRSANYLIIRSICRKQVLAIALSHLNNKRIHFLPTLYGVRSHTRCWVGVLLVDNVEQASGICKRDILHDLL